MSEQFVYTTPLDPRAKPLIEGLTFEYDSRYGDVMREPGQPREMERYPAINAWQQRIAAMPGHCQNDTSLKD